MPCSPEQLASNRRNAQRSTGPKTEQGKARSRANGFKHGRRGAGVALPIEDEAEVEARFEALAEDLKPRDDRERILARRDALLAPRLDRCAQFEASALSEAIRTAVADHDDAIADQVDRAFERLDDDPSGAVRVLSRTPQGVDRMIRAWEDLADGFAHPGYWTFNEISQAENLTGRRKDAPGDSRIMALAAAADGDFRLLEPDDCGPPVDMVRHQGRTDAARVALVAFMRGEADRLRAFRAALPHDDLARSRAEAPLRRLFDPSPAATLFRRYENSAARELHKTFALFDARTDPGPADLPVPDCEKDDLNSNELSCCGKLGSLGNLDAPADAAPEVTTAIAPKSVNSGANSASEGPAPSMNRPRTEGVADLGRSPIGSGPAPIRPRRLRQVSAAREGEKTPRLGPGSS